MLLAPILALGGCWEKIEYTGSAQSSPDQSTATSDSTAIATPAEPTTTGAPSPSVVQTSASAPTAGDRYGNTSPQPSSAALPSADAEVPPKPLNHDADQDRYAISRPPVEPTQLTNPTPAEAAPAPKAAEKPQPPERHTDATPISATVEVKPKRPVLNARRVAWILGDRLSFAALAHDRGLAPESIPKWFGDAQTAAKLLGTSVEALPEPASTGDASPASQQVINYMIAQGRRIGGDVAQKHGRETAALFEVALKSNILLLLYSPNSPATNSIAAAISRAAPQGGLPRELWNPLLETLNKGASLAEVQTAVRKMHADVNQFLAASSEQKPK
jgi:hypothetical protein